MKIINYIFYFLNKRKHVIEALYHYHMFLKNGFYHILPGEGYIETEQPMFPVQKNIVLRILFFKKILIHSDKKYFEATHMRINEKGKGKFFTDLEVLTPSSVEEKEKLFFIYQEIEGFFAYPPIIKNEEKYYIESRIYGTIPTIEEIYKMLIRFYRSQTPKFVYYENIYFPGETKSLEVKSHNDIHFGNLIKKESIYVIDWEYYGYNIFYYDFINLLFVPALDGNNQYLRNYFNGQYDVLFKELFDLFGIPFVDKLLYIYTYLNRRIVLIDKGSQKVDKYRMIIQCAV